MHLDKIAKSLNGYFLPRQLYPIWVRHPLSFSVATAGRRQWWIPGRNHWIAIETGSATTLQNNDAVNILISSNRRISPYCRESLRNTHAVCYKIQAYLCEKSFSMIVDMKTKKINILYCKNDMRRHLQWWSRVPLKLSLNNSRKIIFFVVNIHILKFLRENTFC